MDIARPTPGLPAAAKAQHSGPQPDLEALFAQARSIGRRGGWLSKDENLARLDRVLEDRAARRSQLALDARNYRQARDKRILEKSDDRPFRSPPALDKKIRLYQRVLKALQACAGRLFQPAVLNDQRLEEQHR